MKILKDKYKNMHKTYFSSLYIFSLNFSANIPFCILTCNNQSARHHEFSHFTTQINENQNCHCFYILKTTIGAAPGPNIFLQFF